MSCDVASLAGGWSCDEGLPGLPFSVVSDAWFGLGKQRNKSGMNDLIHTGLDLYIMQGKGR